MARSSALTHGLVKMSSLLYRTCILDWIRGRGIWVGGCQPKRNKSERELALMLNTTSKMWSSVLGEQVVKEILESRGEKVWRPKTMEGCKPDWETEDNIYEVKTRNWTTTGTAGEKILGVPYKYANVPQLYNKPLKIVLVAYQEYEATIKFNIFNPNSKQRQMQIDLWRMQGLEFVKCSELLDEHITFKYNKQSQQ